ncbi:uncharacterized protein LOC134183484 [Corticium candelabrum]|uniref:uncharacterized protein LOC134183484 n=1 Tax=Corticium candelabrum TaxID=121492 RepID=UPI002E265FF0|nr:uncharacterized protein LOC134183484 [Corticium candelabrum]
MSTSGRKERWRKNTKEERKAQKSRRRKRRAQLQRLEEEKKESALVELQEVKRLRHEAEQVAQKHQDEVEGLRLARHDVQLKTVTFGKKALTRGFVSTFVDHGIPVEVPKLNRKDISTAHGNYKEIGSGKFSNCYLGIYRGVYVAVKSIKESVVSKDAVEKEGALLMSLTHPGLPHIFGICIDCSHT